MISISISVGIFPGSQIPNREKLFLGFMGSDDGAIKTLSSSPKKKKNQFLRFLVPRLSPKRDLADGHFVEQDCNI